VTILKSATTLLLAIFISLRLLPQTGQAPLTVRAEVRVTRGTVGIVCLIVEDETSSCWENFAVINTRIFTIYSGGPHRVLARLITRDPDGKDRYQDTPIQTIQVLEETP